MNNILKKIDKIDLILFFSLSLACILSIYNGYISPDSWVYLHLAQSISMGKGIALNDGYFSIFPAGYPLLIALISGFSSNIYALITASKLLNFLLALLSYNYAKKIFKNKIFAMLFILSPLYLTIFKFTWSENLFYASIIASIYYLIKLNEKPCLKYCIYLTLTLILAISSKYFSGPLIFLMFIGYILVYGRKDIVLKFIPFFISGFIFIAYQLFNKKLTEYSSGMPRIEAAESIKLIFYSFISSSIKLTFSALIPVLLVVFFQKTKYKLDKKYLLIIFVGISYLILHLVVRSLSHYDLFGSRILGLGLLLIVFSLVGLIFSQFKLNNKIYILIIISIASGFYIGGYRDISKFKIPSLNSFDYKYVVSLKVESPSGNVSNQARSIYSVDRDEYYGYDTKLITPNLGPYLKVENLDNFTKRIKEIDYGNCVIDFSLVSNESELKSIIGSKYKIDIYPEKYMDSMSPSIQQKFLSIFEPNQLVPCEKLL
jgi:hypothetical protein